MANSNGSNNSQYDIFLSCSLNDREVVSAIADRLTSDGLSVYFDNGSIPLEEVNLRRSRNLVICWSESYLNDRWNAIEPLISLFQNNSEEQNDLERQLVFIDFDNTQPPQVNNQFETVNWQQSNPEPYDQLIEIVLPASSDESGEVAQSSQEGNRPHTINRKVQAVADSQQSSLEQQREREQQELRRKLEEQGDFITLAGLSIGDILESSTRENYLGVLKDSLGIGKGGTLSNIDFEDPTLCQGPEEISIEWAASVEQLHKYYIFLSRKQAVRFLYFKGFKTTVNKFKNQASSDAYHEMFNREISKLDPNNKNSTRVYTYAEILLIVKHDINLRLP